MSEFIYTWTWKTKLEYKKGQNFKVLIFSNRMNSVLIEFENGDKYITSRNALRIIKLKRS